MRRFIKFVVLIALIPLIFAFVFEGFAFFFANSKILWMNLFPYGCLAYVFLYMVGLRPRIIFIETFEHELAHTMMAFLFFRNVHFFAVFPEGGMMMHRGSARSLIALAPYYLPVFTLPLIAVKPFLSSPAALVIDFLIGATLAFHYAGFFKEFSIRQPDIEETGIFRALAVVVFMNAVFTVLALSFAFGQYGYIVDL